MKRSSSRRGRAGTAPAGKLPDGPVRHRRRFARWRALSLSLVYIVFTLHILHWKSTGKTLAPLELNEVMYTLELGIITAGFLFMCVLVLGTLIFGRFFCSWACHIMVLQDLCAWILRKLGIRRKPIRSRLLLLVPPLTALYMFVWPQLIRAWNLKGLPTFHLRTDAEGWASFVTHNFWRNLPSAPIIALTFVVCGFLIVYLLGSRTFCTYVCPYGAVFSLADRFAPGRIRVNDRCKQCGTCTAACTSGVRVHDEVKVHGMIVNPACLKDLDCVSVCPQGALRYTFTKPSLWRSLKTGGRFGRQPYDFSLREEVLMAAVFVFIVLCFRGLYSRIPFLLSLALGAVAAYLTVCAVRLATQASVRVATIDLKDRGVLTRAGRAYAGMMVAFALFVGHCAFVRYHEYSGLRQSVAVKDGGESVRSESLAGSALGHLKTADRWGLFRNERVERSLLDLSAHLRRYEDVETYAGRLLAREPRDDGVRLQLAASLAARGATRRGEQAYRTVIARWARVDSPSPVVAQARQGLGELLAREGRFPQALEELKAASRLNPSSGAVHAALGSVLAETGQLDAAAAELREAVRIEPSLGMALYNLGAIVAQQGRFGEAIPYYQRALAAGLNDADLHNNYGFALLQTGSVEASRKQFERALLLDPKNANAHFNLGNVLAAEGDVQGAHEHRRAAARVDPRYAKLLAQ